MIELIAHSSNKNGERQSLEEHLTNVGNLAEVFAGSFDANKIGRLAGLIHDIGKAKATWQERLLALEAGETPEWNDILHDHKMTSATYAWQQGLEDAAIVIAGHHGGMLDFNKLQATMSTGIYNAGVLETKEKLHDYLTQLDRVQGEISDFYRLLMIFSCLCDADCIDTSSHFSDRLLANTDSLADLNKKLLSWEPPKAGNIVKSVEKLRSTVRAACLQATGLPKGLFTLNAPTGAGKTISGGLWALGHAVHHSMSRVIYVAPYRSIIDQTAGVYADILGERNVLAHHSTSDFWSGKEKEDRLQRQLAENWDTPIVVTTAEQFFESIYSSRPGASRKLHNIVNSVIILDEPQALPHRLLTPCFAAIRTLYERFDCSVLSMTATQPPLHHPALLGKKASSILGNNKGFRRVRVFKSKFENCLYSDLSKFMAKKKQALAIANTRAGALAIYEYLPPASRTYMSTWLCPAHRRDTIAAVRAKLQAGEPCHVASTQVIEAGVDFDFPDLMLRQKAPLDSMIQAFGRCNRNGRGRGHCYIFSPAEGNQLADYNAGIEIVNELLYDRRMNLHSERTMQLYYKMLYARKDLDACGVMENVSKLNFERIRCGDDETRRFQLIEQNTVNVIVPYGTEQQQAELQEAVQAIKVGIKQDQQPGKFRWALRRIQSYTVSLYPNAYEKLENAFPYALQPLLLNYVVWSGSYSQKTGLGNVIASL